ncbi:hypothetical protein HF086_006616 [Spodoptera exigua]|uniref:Uncharacterized protein n=1 Tax=Spodoptera exigua TaxID=7107 RepID=A0A922SBZ1_SPOEX|nr:hypothetical protein HF086_006616 [Spodoptera exigua]
MDILSEIYYKSSVENERNVQFWENYLGNLKNLDFSVFSDKLKVPTLVPIGSRILFRGELIHTNEVTAALEKLDMYIKEKEYFGNQLSLTRKTLYDKEGQEIIEYYSEEEDKVWRAKHRENVRKYKQNKNREEETENQIMTDEELWVRLEELELQEELENELSIITSDTQQTPPNIDESNPTNPNLEQENISKEEKEKEKKKKFHEIIYNEKKDKREETKVPEITSKLDILQQVINKQNELEEKLHELKNRERCRTKDEKDLILEDIIDNEDVEETKEDLEGNDQEGQIPKIQRRVSFVDENDSNTLDITFKHSVTDPINKPYDASKGIQKPSDIYQAHSNLFGTGTTSILKKSKYATADVKRAPKVEFQKESAAQVKSHENGSQEVIVIKDVVEKEEQENSKLLSQPRPTSLFKKKRMQSKS